MTEKNSTQLNMNEIEIWKDCEGFEGSYQISNYGNVRALDRVVYEKPTLKKRNIKGRVLTKRNQNTGYYSVQLFKNGGFKNFLVHRLVAIAFINNQNNSPFVNHIDCNKKNNHTSNLEWCTNSENLQHSKRLGLLPHGETHHLAKLKDADKIEIISLNKSGLKQAEIARRFNIHASVVSRIVNNITDRRRKAKVSYR